MNKLSVEAVSVGKEAITCLRSNKIGLIVLDMIMDPDVHGLETYQRILAINPKQKAIIVSAFFQRRMTQRRPWNWYVIKPYMLEKIGLAIKGERRRARALDP
jgi:two-component system cell cycle sensor histidine kinase/response regulator CckA